MYHVDLHLTAHEIGLLEGAVKVSIWREEQYREKYTANDPGDALETLQRLEGWLADAKYEP